MARGSLAGGGALYYADLLSHLLRRAGTSLDDVRRGLDFGCSSGRVVRALQAAYPHGEWHGADPNEPAIAWAREHLPGIDFRGISPTQMGTQKSFAAVPTNKFSEYVTVVADHAGTPDASGPAVVAWLAKLAAK